MPELPEVQTTVDGIHSRARGLRIVDVWTDYRSEFHKGKDNINDPNYFAQFKKIVRGAKITKASRRAKNVLIHLDNKQTILIHMKMTGHVLYGKYKKVRGKWIAIDAGPLRDDPFNRHVRLIFTLSNGKHLALSDMRRFAKTTLIETDKLHKSKHLEKSGPEPLDKSFNFSNFQARLYLKPKGKIKQVLMNHEIIAGIGNIYSDEILWSAGINPLEQIQNISETKLKLAFKAMKKTLLCGIDVGGDSMSDYRNIDGIAGKFQNKHNAYQKTGKLCSKKDCTGTIKRIIVGGRSGHYCDVHQKLAN